MFANTTGCWQTVLMSLAPNLVTGAAHAYVANPQQPEDEASEEVSTKKSASFRPQTQARQASVKTLGNISREASSGSDELSKLWESAPDVSKFFG